MASTLPWFPPAPAAGPAGILSLPPDDWALEPKIDGIRVIWLDGQPFTRQGTLLSASKRPGWLRKLLADIPFPLDGEWVPDADTFYVFDLPNSQLDYDGRRVALHLALGASRPTASAALDATSVDTCFAGVRLVASFTGGQFPQIYAALKDTGAEARLHDLGKAAERLPSLTIGPSTETTAMQTTGTHDAAPFCSDFAIQNDSGRERLRVIGSMQGRDARKENGPNALQNKEIGAIQEPSRVIEKAPRVGLEPTTNRLTAGCSTIELSGKRLPASTAGRARHQSAYCGIASVGQSHQTWHPTVSDSLHTLTLHSASEPRGRCP